MSSIKVLDSLTTVITDKGGPARVVKAATESSKARLVTETFGLIETTPGLGLRALGWRFYQDPMASDATPLFIEGGTRVQVPVFDGGILSQSYGANSSNWLDPDSRRFYPDALGDLFYFRLNVTIMPLVNNKSVAVDFSIGTANSPFNDSVYLTTGAGVAKPKSFDTQIGASRGFLLNGGAFFLTPEADTYLSRVSVQVAKLYTVGG